MKAITLEDYLAYPSLEVNYLIHRLLPEKGRVALCGPNKAGKSFLGLQVALAVAQGRPFLARHTKQARTLYLQFDTPDPIWRGRFDDLIANNVDLITKGEFALIHPATQERPFNIMDIGQRVKLEKLLITYDPKLVVVDVFSKIHYRPEDSADEMKRIWDILNAVFTDTCLIVIHHTRKPDQQNDRIPRPSDAGRGSGFTGGEVDANWLLWPTENGQAIFSVESRFDEDFELLAIRSPETALWEFPGEAEVRDLNDQLAAMCDEFPGQSHFELSTIVKQRHGLSRATYYRRMSGVKCRHSPTLIAALAALDSTAASPLPD